LPLQIGQRLQSCLSWTLCHFSPGLSFDYVGSLKTKSPACRSGKRGFFPLQFYPLSQSGPSVILKRTTMSRN